MTTDDELIERLRRMKHKFVVPRDVVHEYGLFDEAADRISLLREALGEARRFIQSELVPYAHPERHARKQSTLSIIDQALASSGGGG